jgi:hypothetical protein
MTGLSIIGYSFLLWCPQKHTRVPFPCRPEFKGGSKGIGTTGILSQTPPDKLRSRYENSRNGPKQPEAPEEQLMVMP